MERWIETGVIASRSDFLAHGTVSHMRRLLLGSAGRLSKGLSEHGRYTGHSLAHARVGFWPDKSGIYFCSLETCAIRLAMSSLKVLTTSLSLGVKKVPSTSSSFTSVGVFVFSCSPFVKSSYVLSDRRSLNRMDSNRFHRRHRYRLPEEFQEVRSQYLDRSLQADRIARYRLKN